MLEWRYQHPGYSHHFSHKEGVGGELPSATSTTGLKAVMALTTSSIPSAIGGGEVSRSAHHGIKVPGRYGPRRRRNLASAAARFLSAISLLTHRCPPRTPRCPGGFWSGCITRSAGRLFGLGCLSCGSCGGSEISRSRRRRRLSCLRYSLLRRANSVVQKRWLCSRCIRRSVAFFSRHCQSCCHPFMQHRPHRIHHGAGPDTTQVPHPRGHPQDQEPSYSQSWACLCQ